MTLIDLAAVALAIGAVVDVWMNGDIFSGARSRFESWQEPPESWNPFITNFKYRVLNFLAAGWLCAYCLSYQVGLLILLGWWLAYPATQVIVYVLAAVRLSWLLNKALPNHLQYEEKVDGPTP